MKVDALFPSGSGLVAAAAVALFASAQSVDGVATKRFDNGGIAFRYPRSWIVTTKALSDGVNPKYRFAVSTVLVRRTPEDSGPCLPGIARQIPRSGVLVYLREALGADRRASLPRMQPRPRTFRLPTPADTSLCGFRSGGRWVPFRAGGRAFYLGIYVGPRATPATTRALSRLVDGMKIDPRQASPVTLRVRSSGTAPGAPGARRPHGAPGLLDLDARTWGP